MLGLWLAIVVAVAPEPEPATEVVLTAERVLHDGKRELSTAEGQAKLVTDGTAIDADRIVYDKPRKVATASGHVVARLTHGGRIAIIADVVTLRFDAEDQVDEVFLYDGQAVSKKDVWAEKLLEADTAEKVEKAGTTQALLQGNHLKRNGTKWDVDELELVPCECDFKNPSWSITSTSATVDTEEDRVAVRNAIIRIKHVPVLWLPWLSLPLTERQSGLLFFKPGYNQLNGFMLDQPVYVTLGRSADITFTPGFFTGTPFVKDEKTGVVREASVLGVQGPRLSTEFRYTPSKTATGRVVLGLLYDFRTQRDVENPALRLIGSRRGLRGELGWAHSQDFGSGFSTRVDLNAHSDGDYNRDLTVDVIASTATYLRSSATVFHRGDEHYVGLDVGLRQDIQWGYDVLGTGTLLDPRRVLGSLGPYGPGTLQRLPALTFGWTPSQRLGPVRFELEGEAVRLSPLFSNTGDEGVSALGGALVPETFQRSVDRFFTPSAWSAFGTVRSGIGDRVWQVGEREARDRLMLMPRLSVAAQPLGVFSVSAFAAWRQLGWLGEASGSSWTRGYLLVGGRLETEIARSFFDGAVRHVVQPLAEVRAVPVGFEGTAGAPVAYDAVDAAVPAVTPRFQGVLELRQRLLGRGGAELLRLDVGQGFELSGANYASLTPTLGETYGRLGARFGIFTATGLVRSDPLNRRVAANLVAPAIPGGITRMAGRVDLNDGAHGGLYVAYENVLMEGSARSRQPIDLLFLIDRAFTSTTSVEQVTAGASWNFGPIALRYEALIAPRTLSPVIVAQYELVQQTASVGISPACDCWRIDFAATQITWPTVQAPNVGFNLSISKFGSIGSR